MTSYSISFGPYLKGGSVRLRRMLVLALEGLPANPTPAQLAVLQKAQQGSAAHLQALLSAREGNPYALNRLLKQERETVR